MPSAPPDLQRAWNFYYGRTLPRREKDEDEPDRWRKLESVEPGGELYALTTPLRELGDFGLGVGLYFSSRVAMVLMFSLIGFLNALTIMAYYRSDDYDTKVRGARGAGRGSSAAPPQPRRHSSSKPVERAVLSIFPPRFLMLA